MGFDYDRAAATYDNHRGGGGPYLPVLLRLAGASNARCVLEIGPGTGNNTAAFLEAHPCLLLGLERSRGMLEKAVAKRVPARWVRGDARHIPFAEDSCEFVFGVLVLHHIVELGQVMRECRRVLRKGHAAFVTSPHDFIERHPMNRYFPSFARIDHSRFHTVEAIRQALEEAGFVETGAERMVAPPAPIDRRYLAKVENRFISTYDLIPRDEYDRGLARLRADIEKKGALDEVMRWESVTVWGRT